MNIGRVNAINKEAILMGCYMDVVFSFVAKVPSQSCFCAFSVLISSHALSFFKMYFITLVVNDYNS